MKATDDAVTLRVRGDPWLVNQWLDAHQFEPDIHGVRPEGAQLSLLLRISPTLARDLVQKAAAGLAITLVDDPGVRAPLASVVGQGNRFMGDAIPSGLASTAKVTAGSISYFNDAEVATAIDNLARFSTLARVLKLPHSTWQHRVVKALWLSTDHQARRPAVLMTGCVHGDEWGSCEVLLNLASGLLRAAVDGSGLTFAGHQISDQEIREILLTRDLILVPVVNPDGRHATQTDPRFPRHRRNARPKAGEVFAAAVDINRNFDFLFDEERMHPEARNPYRADPDADTYRGPWAASEPETRNVCYLLDRFFNIHWLVDLHAPGECICHPWGVDEAQSIDAGMNFRAPAFDGMRGRPNDAYREFLCQEDRRSLQRLSNRLSADIAAAGGPTYATGPLFTRKPILGTAVDYAYVRHLQDARLSKVLPFLVEWSKDDPQPLPNDMQDIVHYLAAGLIGFCRETLSDT